MDSSFFPVALCLFSAVTVAATNMFVKRSGDVLSTRMIVSIAMALTVLPAAPFVAFPDADLWQALGFSVMVHWLYQFAMIRALHRGDLSLVFPVMRGLAPLITALLATFFLAETISPAGWLGLCLASLALLVFALPEKTLASAHPKLQQSALFWAVLTALGIAAYSVVDAYGSRIAADTSSVLTFIVWLFLLDWLGISSALLISRRGQVWQTIRPHLANGLIGGFLGTLSYAAALWAFTLSQAANVTAIRETSVVFGALFGAVFLKEAFGRRRIFAASLLAGGLMLLEFAP